MKGGTSTVAGSHSNVVYMDKRREQARMVGRHVSASGALATEKSSIYPYAVALVALAGGVYLYSTRENPGESLIRCWWK